MNIPSDAVKCRTCNGKGAVPAGRRFEACRTCNLVGFVSADGEPLATLPEETNR